MANWPASLPQRIKLEGNSLKANDGTLRTQVDRGPDFTRPITTAVTTPMRGSMNLTTAQFATLEAFYHDTLVEGADAFTWVHPITGASVNMRFLTSPDYRTLSGEIHEVALDLEMLP